MTNYKINRGNRWCLLLCSVCSACISVPSDTGETFGASDSISSGSISSTGDPGSGATSESGAESGSNSDSSPDTDSGATTEMSPPDLGPPSDDPNQQIPPLDEEGCHGLYAQDLLPTFEITMSEEVWDELVQEWENGSETKEMGLDHNPYHPLDEFRYGEILITDAQVRLRGNPDFWNPEDKMQFQIGFNQNEKSGRFLGLRRLALDAATYNRHMLRDRLALSIMRDMGIYATCANNARLVINGEYYGIFTNLEKLDEEFLQRVFADPTGDLWDRHSWELKTNEDSTNDDRLTALLAAEEIEELEEYLDFEQALRVFAAEAILPDSDGMWAGGTNFFLYDDPVSGKFLMLPWDMDNTFERFSDPPDGDYPVNPDPVVWEKPTTHGRPWYDEALKKDEWFEYYIEVIAEQFESSYEVEPLHAQIDAWTAQIQDSVLEDTNKPYSNETYMAEVEQLREYVHTRHEFMEEWLECWKNDGEPDDEGYCEEP